MKLSGEWRKAWTWFSVHLAAACAIFPEIYEHADLLQDYLEPPMFRHVMFVLGILAIVSRFVRRT